VALAVPAVLLAGCSEPPAVAVTPADVTIDARVYCQHLDVLLPSRLDGRRTIPTTPSSRYTAAWGDPAVVMRCGVTRPAGLTRTSEVIEVDRVDWFLVETDDTYVFTTVNRATNVEVSVPTSVPRTEATAPLVGLAPGVRAAIPNAP
jgi:Protein of unknown function (DUF3515)